MISQGVVYYDYNDITGRRDSTSTTDTKVDYTYDHLGRLNTARLVKRNGNTVSELTSYTYNAVGSRAGMTLPNSVTTGYTYDALNRLTHIGHANSVDTIASYTYTLAADGKRTGLAEILDRPSPDGPEDNIIDYTYDNLSRIRREHADANGTSDYYQIDYEYSIVGNRLKRIVNTGGQTLTTTYEYDPNTDQLIKELHDGPELAFLWQNRRVYAPQGRITHYQIQGRPGSIGPFKASILGLPSVWSRYFFIAVMALLAVAFFAPVIFSFLSHQLSLLSRPLSFPSRPLSFPRRRESTINTSATSATSVAKMGLWRRCLCVLLAYVMLISPVGFESLARADTLYSQLQTTDWHSGDRTIQYSYDDNGSVASKTTIETSDPNNVIETVTYEYNLQNRLESVTVDSSTTTYKYNPDGIRVEKTVGGTTTKYVVDPYNHTGYAQVLEEWDTTSTPTLIKTYTIGDDVITQAASTSIEHLLYDGHGSTRQLVDSSENVTATYSYDAYGNMLGGNPGTPQNPGSPATNLLYAGEQFDTDMQQYYLRARYYDQNTGRFNRRDPFAGNNQDPQSLHKYLYCHNNPINGMDPSGMFTLPELLFVVVALVVLAALIPWVLYKQSARSTNWGVSKSENPRKVALVHSTDTSFVGSIASAGVHIGDFASELRGGSHTVDTYADPNEDTFMAVLNNTGYDIVVVLAHGADIETGLGVPLDRNNRPFVGMLLGGIHTNDYDIGIHDSFNEYDVGYSASANLITANELEGTIHNSNLELVVGACVVGETDRLHKAVGSQQFVGLKGIGHGTHARQALEYVVERVNGSTREAAGETYRLKSSMNVVYSE